MSSSKKSMKSPTSSSKKKSHKMGSPVLRAGQGQEAIASPGIGKSAKRKVRPIKSYFPSLGTVMTSTASAASARLCKGGEGQGDALKQAPVPPLQGDGKLEPQASVPKGMKRSESNDDTYGNHKKRGRSAEPARSLPTDQKRSSCGSMAKRRRDSSTDKETPKAAKKQKVAQDQHGSFETTNNSSFVAMDKPPPKKSNNMHTEGGGSDQKTKATGATAAKATEAPPKMMSSKTSVNNPSSSSNVNNEENNGGFAQQKVQVCEPAPPAGPGSAVLHPQVPSPEASTFAPRPASAKASPATQQANGGRSMVLANSEFIADEQPASEGQSKRQSDKMVAFDTSSKAFNVIASPLVKHHVQTAHTMTGGIDDVIDRSTSVLEQPQDSSCGNHSAHDVIQQNTLVHESPCAPRKLDSQFDAGENGSYRRSDRQNNHSSGGSRQGLTFNEEDPRVSHRSPGRYQSPNHHLAAGWNGSYQRSDRQNNHSSGGSRQGLLFSKQESSVTYGYGSPDRHGYSSNNQFAAGGSGSYYSSVGLPNEAHAVDEIYSLSNPDFRAYLNKLEKALSIVHSNRFRSPSSMSPYGTPSKGYHRPQDRFEGTFNPLWVELCDRWLMKYGSTVRLSARREAACDKEVCEVFMDGISFNGHLPSCLRQELNTMLDDLQECIRLRKIRHYEIRQAKQLECAREKKPYVMSDQGIAHREFYEHLEYIHQLITQLMSNMS